MSDRKAQSGVAAVEFALVSLLLFTFLIGIMEIARVMFTMNALNEATRLGARVAVVCQVGDGTVENDPLQLRHMRTFLPDLARDNGSAYVEYPANDATTRLVSVWIEGYKVKTFIPLAHNFFPIPEVRTTISGESFLGSSTGSPPHEKSSLCVD